MRDQSVFQSINDSQDIIVSWKGGVGKSTISAALALHYSENNEKTIAIDMDAAHSISDSLWYDIWKVPEGTSSVMCNENLSLYFLWKIIPDFFEWETLKLIQETWVDFTKLNNYLDSIVDRESSFLSLMRLATYDNFVSIAKDHENVAYIIQLLDLFEKSLIHKIEWTNISSQKIDNIHARRIIDSENTKWLMRILKSLVSVKTTITNMHKAFHWNFTQKASWTITREAIKRQDTLYKFANWPIAKSPESYISGSENFLRSIIKAKVIIITAPGYNEINQTIQEIGQLIAQWITPAHIVVNKYKDHFDKDPDNTQAAYNQLISEIGNPNIWVSKSDSEFEMMPYNISQEEKMVRVKNNLSNITQVI